MSDLISRDEAAEKIRMLLRVASCEAIVHYNHGAGDALATIKNLPSAQPEITRCKDCKWCEDADGLMCKNTASWVIATDYDFGCVCAERRQDDLISRQAAIDAVKGRFSMPVDNLIVEVIGALPSAEPEQRWIPVRYRGNYGHTGHSQVRNLQ